MNKLIRISIERFKELTDTKSFNIIKSPKTGRLFVVDDNDKKYRCHQELDFNKPLMWVMEEESLNNKIYINAVLMNSKITEKTILNNDNDYKHTNVIQAEEKIRYITVSNLKKILREIDYKTVECRFNDNTMYKKSITFFNNNEKKELFVLKEFFMDAQNTFNKYYKPIAFKDTRSYVFEGGKPSYHSSYECEKLHSNFVNYEIPEKIKMAGDIEVNRYRIWFKSNYEQFSINYEKLGSEFKMLFDMPLNLELVDYRNSGFDSMENLDLAEMESRIDHILIEEEKYFNENPDKHYLITKYKRVAYLGNYSKCKDEEITKNESIREFLNFYQNTFKIPVKTLLTKYYQILYNPKMGFDGSLLEQLNFRPCSSCCKD